jgi:hypothetical protein
MNPLAAVRLSALVDAGWRLTRDGSTATAQFVWEDPEESEDGWEILVLHTAGHGARITINVEEAGLTERSTSEVRRFHEATAQALTLAETWQGELPDESDLD